MVVIVRNAVLLTSIRIILSVSWYHAGTHVVFSERVKTSHISSKNNPNLPPYLAVEREARVV